MIECKQVFICRKAKPDNSFYGKLAERIFGADPSRETPAISMADGIDYVPMPKWKTFLIQFLNIAGLGPIFGAVAGAMWGPVAFLWIVLGAIFAGGVHDYFCQLYFRSIK